MEGRGRRPPPRDTANEKRKSKGKSEKRKTKIEKRRAKSERLTSDIGNPKSKTENLKSPALATAHLI
jgi:hypothetical protein